MRKYLTTGLFSAILGLAVGAPADAALVSRGFLDEALENYATTTALDLKANQSDFTDLNTEISGSVDVLRQLLEQGGYSYEFVNSIDPEKFPNTISGASFLLYQYLERFAGSILHGWTDSNGTYYAGFADLSNGWTDSEKKTYLGVKGLNDKIGTLPSGDLLPSKGLAFLLPDPEYQTYPTTIGDFMGQMYGGYLGLSGLAEAVYHGNEFTGQTDTARQVKGLRQITDEIGTLPKGEIAPSPGFDNFLSMYSSITNTPISYPTSVAEFVELLLGNSSNPGLLGLMSSGVSSIDSNSGAPIGILANYLRINDMSEKIGTLPDGYETVGAALTAIKGIAEDAKAAALSAIPDPKAEGSTGKFVLTVDIVGDNATYRWEKIDREGETTTTE